MTRSTLAGPPELFHLVDVHQWHRLQDHFARVLGIPLRTVNPSGTLLLPPSWPPTLLNDQAIALL
jgi:hypothetical protein